MAAIVFWTSVVTLCYLYVGYPALIIALGRWRHSRPGRARVRPSVSLVIAAHNEAAVIARKLDNALALDYPRDRLEILVASDGSDDGTVEIARAYGASGVRVLAFPIRRGKPAVLSDAVPRARGEIVVLADARQRFDRGALIALVEDFADPAVGAVSGELILAEPGETVTGRGVGFYWRYEKVVRLHESLWDSTVGVTGAIYAIRRDLFEPIAADTLLDDVLIPLRIVRRGYRVVFEPAARAFDDVAETARQEFTRKVRTIAGNVQLFSRERWLWNPLANRLWLQAMSHKLLRVLGPAFVVLALGASAALARRQPFYGVVLGGQLAFYAAAAVGAVVRRPRGPWLAVPYAFCLLNLATVVGVFRFVAGGQRVTWRRARAPRGASLALGDKAGRPTR